MWENERDFYTFLTHMGASFIKKDGSGQKIRSIDYGFELMVEKCRSSDDKL